jgi:hypothetical protein
MTMNERSLSKTAWATAPLLVWAAHFAALYGIVAAQCSPAAAHAEPSLALLWVVSALAVGACAALLWRARQALAPHASPRAPQTSLAQLAQAASALLALAAIAWTSVPLLLLGGCG